MSNACILFDRLVGDTEFSQVVANHFSFDFNGSELGTVVHANHGTDHFRDNDHVTEVGLDYCWLFTECGSALGLSQFLDQGEGLPFESTVEAPACTAREELNQLVIGHVQQLVQVSSSVRELSEGSLLASLLVILSFFVEFFFVSHG